MVSSLWWMTWLSGLTLGFALGMILTSYLVRRYKTELSEAEIARSDLASQLSLREFFVTDLEYQVRGLKRDLREAWFIRRKLDTRIRNQRIQLRMNWEILETRNADHHRLDVRTRMLARCLAYRDRADRASGALEQIRQITSAAGPQPREVVFHAQDETHPDRSSEEDC